MPERIHILKTYKVFINGQFPRSESGRYFELLSGKRVIANVCLCSRKDVKAAVSSAKQALSGWSGKTAYNRAQILYRLAEMVESRRDQLLSEMLLQGYLKKKAQREIDFAIDRIIYYAGWCDKFQHLFSSVNPVAGNFHNFSVPEPSGVVAILAPEKTALLGFLSLLLPVIVGGNTCLILASEKYPLTAVTFAEALATSDIPPGVVNILTGKSSELHTDFSSHMEINALIYAQSSKSELNTCMKNAAHNVKRVFYLQLDWFSEQAQNPYLIMNTQEIKTTWHPVDCMLNQSVKY